MKLLKIVGFELASVATWEPLTHARQDTVAAQAPLTVEQVVRNLEQRTKERTQALRHFEGMRATVYSIVASSATAMRRWLSKLPISGPPQKTSS